MAAMRMEGPLAIVPWVVVFGVGFGVGYALMSAMVDEPAVGEPQAVGDDPPAPPAPADEASEVAAPAGAAAAEPLAGEAPVPPPVALPESAKAEPTPGAAAEAEAAAEAKPKPWWEHCLVEDCTIDFGGITGGLSIRRASLEHGTTVSWDRDFARRPRQEVLPTRRGVKVKLRSVGLDASGKPVAAEIVYSRTSGPPIEGVISLDLGEPGKQVTFRP